MNDALDGKAPLLSANPDRIWRGRNHGWVIPFMVTLFIYLIYYFCSTTYGYDTVTRSLMGLRWLQHPFYIYASNPITWVFGPFQCYINALSVLIFQDPNIGPRLLSTLFGIMTVIPLYYIAREIFNRRAAYFAALAFPFFTVYTRLAVSANAESLSGFLFLMAIYLILKFEKSKKIPCSILAGFCMTLAAATRYEMWVFIPVIGVFLLYRFMATQERSFLWGMVLFVAIAMLFPISWFLGNYIAHGTLFDFFPRDDISEQFPLRGGNQFFNTLYILVFLPGVLFLSLSPFVFILSMKGIVQQIKVRTFDLMQWLIGGFCIYYFGIFVVLRTSTSLARHANLPGLFLLMFFGAGLAHIQDHKSKRYYLNIRNLTIALMILLNVLLIPFNKPSEGLAEKLRAISPIVQDPDFVDSAAADLKSEAIRGARIFLDAGYYNHRMLYLKTYGYWGNIGAYFGDPSGFIPAAAAYNPDILVVSPANKRLRNLLPQDHDSITIDGSQSIYIKDKIYGLFVLYTKPNAG